MKLALYQHQKDIINEDPKKCGIFYGTGSGKTLIALSLAQGRTLVICPKTQRDDKNWQRQLEKMDKKLHLDVVSKEEFKRDYELYKKYDTIIMDEVHTMCGVSPSIVYRQKKPYPKTSQIFDACLDAVKFLGATRVYLCTATPTRNPMAVYALGLLLGRDWDFWKFRQIYYVPIKIGVREIWMPKKDKETQERLGKCVRGLGYTGRLDQFMDVPEQSYKTIYVDLTDEQKKKLKDLPLDYPDPLVLCGKRNQVENGILCGDEFSKTEYFNTKKIEVILDLAIEFPQLVVFAKYRDQIEQIAISLRKEGKKVLTLTGDTKDRGNVIEEANKSEDCVLIVSSQISAGWELPKYPCMVFASMSYSIVDRLQSEGRILRANHLKKNLYITLISKGDTVDEAVYKSIQNKQDFSEAIYSKVC